VRLTDIGISHQIANTIASASQAVDDFHEEKLIVFENGELFYPIITAHKMLDSDNLDSRDASNIWMPFHFFPNDEGICEPDTKNVTKLIQFVKDYSYQNEEEKYLIHGILLHIFVDTYTHKGFIGLNCKHNDISDLDDKDMFFDLSLISSNLPPSMGHGEALTYPDDMWRRWSYSDNKDETVDRDNQEIFLTVTQSIQSLMAKLGYDVNELSEQQLNNYKKIFAIKGNERNYEENITKRFDSITQGNVGEGKNISYPTWKKAIMRKVQSKENKYIRTISEDDFENSRWVVFQKLAKNVRTFFKKDIFPHIRIKTTVYYTFKSHKLGFFV
jgi:hypothetical protein